MNLPSFGSCVVAGTSLNIRSARKGTTVMANIQLYISEIITTQNRCPVYSAVEPGAKPIGAKASIPTSVPPNKGQIDRLIIFLTISSFLSPRCVPTSMPSVTTMALSTNIPSAMINAPNEMRCMGMFNRYIVASVAAIVMIKVAPIIMDDFIPMKKNKVTSTMASAATTFNTKLCTASSVILPW